MEKASLITARCAKILGALTGLPVFPREPGPVNTVPKAAFEVDCGPACLVREVLLPPVEVKVCPDVIYELLEDARICQNASQHEGALRRYKEALRLWGARVYWKALNDGMDPSEIDWDTPFQYAALEAKASAAFQQQQTPHRKRAAAADDTTAEADGLAEALAGEGEGEDEEKDEEEAEQEGEEEEDEEETEEEREARKQRAAAAAAEAEAAQAAAAAAAALANQLPTVSLESELEFMLFIWNSIGSVLQSQNKDQEALVYFWRAKQSHDYFLQTKDSTASLTQSDLAEFMDIDITARKFSESKLDGPTGAVQPIHPFEYSSPATALTYSNLGAACYHLQQYDLALRCFYAAQQIRFLCIDSQSDEFVDIGSTLNNIGVCLFALQRYVEAYSYMLSAEELMTEMLHPMHPRLECVQRNVAKVRRRQQKIKLDVDKISQVLAQGVEKAAPFRKFRVELSEAQKLKAKFGSLARRKGRTKGKASAAGKKKRRTKRIIKG